MKPGPAPDLAASITRAASKQTYYTIRLLVDRERVADAYRAYAYFRWLDDRLDRELEDTADRLAFVERQRRLVNDCYRGVVPSQPCLEERMLVELVHGDREAYSGLQAYIRNMMAVMAFDAQRRGRLAGREELAEYTRRLATAVTEALHYFVGHACRAPRSKARYLAASGAHITHMLRDALEDNAAGYYNIPREYLEAHAIAPEQVSSPAYRTWVAGRVRTARACFAAGKVYLAQVENLRCRIAGHAYIARFEGVLDTIEREGYQLQAGYQVCSNPLAGINLGWEVLWSALLPHPARPTSLALPAKSRLYK
jgi:phytoene/squalene synthetase